VPVGALVGTGLISRTSDHHRLLRAAGACTFATAVLAAPLFWLEVGGASAFLAFAIAGGMFAVSVPTNVVIGTRLRRETRASAMGIAVGILMGSQALGATAGGLLASTIGPPQAIAGALVAAAVFGGWSTLTTPIGAKHMAGQRQLIGAGAPTTSVSAVPQVVVDLVALEAEASESDSDRGTDVQALSVG
jgi:predicted MFS family arabinose efflux permease